MQFFWKDHLFRTFGKIKYGFSCSVMNDAENENDEIIDYEDFRIDKKRGDLAV